MTTRTRYFMAGSAGILLVGLAIGLIAHYGGFPPLAASRTGPAELSYVPQDATVVAYANVRDVMLSDFRQRIRRALPGHREDGHAEFERKTGINIETDVDHVVACLITPEEGQDGSGFAIVRGRFDVVRLEALAREQEGVVEEYRGRRLVLTRPHAGAGPADGRGTEGVTLAFMEPGLVALGTDAAIRRGIDAQLDGGGLSANAEIMRLVAEIDLGSNAWAVGRFDALSRRAQLPEQVKAQLPPITWFAANGRVNGGITGTVRAEARDEESAENLRDVVRGFLALARMQAGAASEYQAILQSLQMTGTGRTVAVSFSVPAEAIDAMTPGH